MGAIVGGVFALAGTLAVELRRDRRQLLGAARLILGELDRAIIERQVLTEEEPKPCDPSWKEGPHHGIRTGAWDANAAHFVARLDGDTFRDLDHAETELARAAEWGFTHRGGQRLLRDVAEAYGIVQPFSRPTWFDRHVWRL